MQISTQVEKMTPAKAFGRVDIPDSLTENRSYRMSFTLDDKFDSALLRGYVQRELYDNIRIHLHGASIYPSSRREATSTLNVIRKGFNTINIYMYGGANGMELVVEVVGKDINRELVVLAQRTGSGLMMATKRDMILNMNLSARLSELGIHENPELRK